MNSQTAVVGLQGSTAEQGRTPEQSSTPEQSGTPEQAGRITLLWTSSQVVSSSANIFFRISGLCVCVCVFFKIFFDVDHFSNVFIEFVQSFFWPQGLCDLSSLIRDQTCSP